MKYDVVYFVKEAPENPELTYSLRSLKNFPHGKVGELIRNKFKEKSKWEKPNTTTNE